MTTKQLWTTPYILPIGSVPIWICLTILEETKNKPLRSRWVPSHRDIAKAKTKEERIEIKRNNQVDRLAKMATGLPLPKYTYPPR